jgi:hypothetical protein
MPYESLSEDLSEASKPTEHQGDHREVDPGLTGGAKALTLLCSPDQLLTQQAAMASPRRFIAPFLASKTLPDVVG